MKPLLALFLFVLFGLGIACLFFPSAIQSVAVKTVSMGLTGKSEALLAFVQSKQYLFSVRAVGVLALIAAVFVTFALFKSS